MRFIGALILTPIYLALAAIGVITWGMIVDPMECLMKIESLWMHKGR